MPDNFDKAIEITLEHEGGLYHNTKTGEIANFGVTHWFLRSVGVFPAQPHETPATPHEVAYIQAMTREQAIEIYREHFWKANHLDEIADEKLACKVFDLTVNMGAGGRRRNGDIADGGVTLLQRAAAALGASVTVDGRFGPASAAAVNGLDATALYAKYMTVADARYRAIAVADPRHKDDLAGWLKRLDS